MSIDADSNVPSHGSGLDPLTLWLNLENKLDELRSRFLTIASLLFTLQSGIFALMLDKIFLTDTPPALAASAEVLLIVLSVLGFIFLFTTSAHYASHIDTNELRSRFVAESDAIRQFTQDLRIYLQTKSVHHEPRNPKGVVRVVWGIYGVLFLLTVGLPVLREILY